MNHLTTDKKDLRATASLASDNDRFALLALDGIHREYPNANIQLMSSDADARPPRELFPAFYGCYDWHSSVHGHWLLVRMLKTDKKTLLHDRIISALSRSISEENLAVELTTFSSDNRRSFERPYGYAWYLQLSAELAESDNALHQQWRLALQPLEDLIVSRILAWLPNLVYPIRTGTHAQTAFSFGLMLDYARTVSNSQLEQAIVKKSLAFHQQDTHGPLSYEPSGSDFLSPCLMEADLMRRILEREDFSRWLSDFLPQIPHDGSDIWLAPSVVLDNSDGQLSHLHGLNLSRAFALEGIASRLPEQDSRRAALLATAARHETQGVAAVNGDHYMGSHWLGSLAVYLKTKRGINSTHQGNSRL